MQRHTPVFLVTAVIWISACRTVPRADTALRDEEAVPAVDLRKPENHVKASASYAKLSDTGFGGSGVSPFSPQYPLWTDGMKKRRWISLPAGAKIDTTDMDQWVFPAGTKLWKEFGVAKGDGGVRKVETRYMEKLADGRWAYATFVWDDAQQDPKRADNQQNIRNVYPLTADVKHDVPSHSNCVFCHQNGKDPVLGFSALQLSDERDPLAPHADKDLAGTLLLSSLVADGRLTKAPAAMPVIKARSAKERAALGYLNGNCSSCHSPLGRARQYSMDFKYRLGHDAGGCRQTSLVRIDSAAVDTVSQEFKLPGTAWPAVNYAVFPGDPEKSQIVHRLRERKGRHKMPKVGSKIVDDQAIALVEAWIEEMPASAAHAARALTGKTDHPQHAAESGPTPFDLPAFGDTSCVPVTP